MLINGRTPEEIKHVTEWACFSCGGLECDECEYRDACTIENRDRAVPDALALIQRLEAERDAALAKVPKWISVKERLPKNGELVLITMNDEISDRKLFDHAYELACYWRDGEDEEGEYHIEGWDLWDYRDGEVSKLEVFYWMPLPEPKENE